MKNKFVIVMLVALITVLWIPLAYSQSNCTVRGKIIGEDGKPLGGASVVYSNDETGRKYSIKADKSGNYYSITVVAGRYKVSLLDASGQPLYPGFFVWADVSIQNPENVTDVNIQKARAEQGATMSDEQKKKIEALKQENAKIGSLNDKLKLSAQQQTQGLFEDSVKTMEEAVQIDSSRDVVLASLGNAYLMAGRHNADHAAAKDEFTKAVDAYKKAIAIKPTVGAYYNNMGEAYAKIGDTQAAVDAYTQAAQNDPTEAAKYYFNLGAILTNSGKVDEANAAFNKAILADPNKADAYYQRAINLLGRMCGPSTPPPCVSVDKDGKVLAPPEVAQGLNKYLELAPDGPFAQTAKDTITMLGAKVETSFGKKAPSAPRKK